MAMADFLCYATDYVLIDSRIPHHVPCGFGEQEVVVLIIPEWIVAPGVWVGFEGEDTAAEACEFTGVAEFLSVYRVVQEFRYFLLLPVEFQYEDEGLDEMIVVLVVGFLPDFGIFS